MNIQSERQRLITCKDCCENSNETGPYENCPKCGSHRIMLVPCFRCGGETSVVNGYHGCEVCGENQERN